MPFFAPARAAYVENPYPSLHRLRREAPVWRSPDLGAWIVTAHAACAEVLRDHTRFSSDPAVARGVDPALVGRRRESIPFGEVPSLSSIDPPAHARLRRVLVEPFSPAAAERVRGVVREVVADVLGTLPADGPFDAMASVADVVPERVMLALAGIPPERREEVGRWLRAIARVREQVSFDPLELADARRAAPLLAGFVEEVRSARDEHSPNVLRELLEAEGDGVITPAELMALLVHVAVVGTGPLAGLIGNALLALARFPEEHRRLLGGEVSWENAVHEFLRYDGPTHAVPRVVRCDTELRGARLRAGDVVYAMVGAANRDPAVFPEPDRLDLSRDARAHLSFGAGPHFCLGAPLARIVAEETLAPLLQRLGRYRVVRVRWMHPFELRAPKELVLERGAY
ncbi:Polyketide biosynthesis cytochrome P450 PksS [bacterium HR29]|jgi:cytochrome P450|nr:Polyketide biosynthesis cytochrome P450 PksS [bacterium HR29]